jgi:hypothetical protein
VLKFRNREDEMKNLFGIYCAYILLALAAKAVTVSFADDYKTSRTLRRVPVAAGYP